jgi:hypothetical protein
VPVIISFAPFPFKNGREKIAMTELNRTENIRYNQWKEKGLKRNLHRLNGKNYVHPLFVEPLDESTDSAFIFSPSY